MHCNALFQILTVKYCGIFIHDDASSGRPSTLVCAEVVEQVDRRVRGNRRINTDEISAEMNIDNGKKRCKNSLRPNHINMLL
jgi:hypothetical protein